MAKEQLIGVVFLSNEDKARAQDNVTLKEYLYKDTLGCAIDEIVVVEARDSVSLARVVSIYVDTITKSERPIRHVVSKVESSYTRKQKELQAKKERLSVLENMLREKCAEAGWLAVCKALARSDETIAELLDGYIEMLEEVADES